MYYFWKVYINFTFHVKNFVIILHFVEIIFTILLFGKIVSLSELFVTLLFFCTPSCIGK